MLRKNTYYTRTLGPKIGIHPMFAIAIKSAKVGLGPPVTDSSSVDRYIKIRTGIGYESRQ